MCQTQTLYFVVVCRKNILFWVSMYSVRTHLKQRNKEQSVLIINKLIKYIDDNYLVICVHLCLAQAKDSDSNQVFHKCFLRQHCQYGVCEKWRIEDTKQSETQHFGKETTDVNQTHFWDFSCQYYLMIYAGY